jgi:zinc transporter ZupT
MTAGGFLYIAGSDLLPELHHEVKPKNSFLQLFFMLLGIAIMTLLLLFE